MFVNKMAGSSISFSCLSPNKKAVEPSVNVVQRLRMRQVVCYMLISFEIPVLQRSYYLKPSAKALLKFLKISLLQIRRRRLSENLGNLSFCKPGQQVKLNTCLASHEQIYSYGFYK